MRKYLISLISIIISLIFTGCTNNYNLEPKFNDQKNELTIDTLILKNASSTYKNSPFDTEYMGTFKREQQSFVFDNNQCTKLFYYKMTAGERAFISDNIEINLKEKAVTENLRCNATKIGNVGFYACLNQNHNYDYSIGTSHNSRYGGFSKVEGISLDKQCFNTILNHFKEKANIEKISIEKYKIRRETIEKPNPKKCNYNQYDKNKNIVVDNITGNIWNNHETPELTFEDAKAYCQKLNHEKFGGCHNWRLPYKNELESLYKMQSSFQEIITKYYYWGYNNKKQWDRIIGVSMKDNSWLFQRGDFYNNVKCIAK